MKITTGLHVLCGWTSGFTRSLHKNRDLYDERPSPDPRALQTRRRPSLSICSQCFPESLSSFTKRLQGVNHTSPEKHRGLSFLIFANLIDKNRTTLLVQFAFSLLGTQDFFLVYYSFVVPTLQHRRLFPRRIFSTICLLFTDVRNGS